VLIGHAENDWDIPHTHSDVLFDAFLEPHLPSVITPENPFTLTQADWGVITEQRQSRKTKREAIVKSTTVDHFGRVDKFLDGDRKIMLVKTLVGGHDYLGVQEGLVDIIGKTFGIP